MTEGSGPARPTPIRELLDGLRRELVALHGLSVGAQDMMGEVLDHAALTPDQLRRAQSLDLITQRLECLCALAGSMVATSEQGWLVDAGPMVRQLTLSDVQGRLLGCGAAGLPTGGAVEIF